MDTTLNLMNKIAENDAERLVLDKNRDAEYRRMDLYIAQSNSLIALGYINDNLVWFSSTSINDLFLTRRVFDCMKVGVFYRKANLDVTLAVAGLLRRDLENMCHVGVEHIERSYVDFRGCLVNQAGSETQDAMTGVEFAKIVAVLPMRLRSVIANIGSDNDILDELEKDYAFLNAICHDKQGINETRYLNAKAICQKWQSAECLKLSDRASIRVLYHDICYMKLPEPSN